MPFNLSLVLIFLVTSLGKESHNTTSVDSNSRGVHRPFKTEHGGVKDCLYFIGSRLHHMDFWSEQQANDKKGKGSPCWSSIATEDGAEASASSPSRSWPPYPPIVTQSHITRCTTASDALEGSPMCTHGPVSRIIYGISCR